MPARLCSFCRGTGSIRVVSPPHAIGLAVVAWAVSVPTPVSLWIVEAYSEPGVAARCVGCVVTDRAEAKRFEGCTVVRVSNDEAAKVAEVKSQKIRGGKRGPKAAPDEQRKLGL